MLCTARYILQIFGFERLCVKGFKNFSDIYLYLRVRTFDKAVDNSGKTTFYFQGFQKRFTLLMIERTTKRYNHDLEILVLVYKCYQTLEKLFTQARKYFSCTLHFFKFIQT